MSAVTRKLIVAVLVLSWTGLASAQTADEVIEKHLAAIGGRAALTKIKSRTMTGTIALCDAGRRAEGSGGSPQPGAQQGAHADQAGSVAVGAGEMTVDQRFDGTAGIVMDSMQGNRDIGGDQLETMRNTTFPSSLAGLQGARYDRRARAEEKVGARDAFVLTTKGKTGPPDSAVHRRRDLPAAARGEEARGPANGRRGADHRALRLARR